VACGSFSDSSPKASRLRDLKPEQNSFTAVGDESQERGRKLQEFSGIEQGPLTPSLSRRARETRRPCAGFAFCDGLLRQTAIKRRQMPSRRQSNSLALRERDGVRGLCNFDSTESLRLSPTQLPPH